MVGYLTKLRASYPILFSIFAALAAIFLLGMLIASFGFLLKVLMIIGAIAVVSVGVKGLCSSSDKVPMRS